MFEKKELNKKELEEVAGGHASIGFYKFKYEKGDSVKYRTYTPITNAWEIFTGVIIASDVIGAAPRKELYAIKRDGDQNIQDVAKVEDIICKIS